MDKQNMLEQARKNMHRAEDALKYYVLSGGVDLKEFALLSDTVRVARNEFLSQFDTASAGVLSMIESTLSNSRVFPYSTLPASFRPI
jgi:hypothetical protein